MNYFRKIIYLSEYNGGECLGNIGFAKLSKKQTRLKIEISLSGDHTLRGEKVYLLDKDKSAVNKVFFGTITEEGKEITLEKSTGEAGMFKGQLAGILIGGEGYVTCAGTDDASVRVMDYIRVDRETEKEKTVGELKQHKREIAAVMEMPKKVRAAEEEREEMKEIKTESDKDHERDEKAPEPECVSETVPAPKEREAKLERERKETEDAKVSEPEGGTGTEADAEPKQEEEPPEEGEMVEVELGEEHDAAYMYRNLFANSPNMYPFEDDEMEECVQISPADFSGFPKEYWHMGSNTFLLQGYYNYRHLILAKKGDKIYVGVPGQYHRRDKYMADMFGFGLFKSILRKKERLGDFGYWMMEIEIPPSSEEAVCVSEK